MLAGLNSERLSMFCVVCQLWVHTGTRMMQQQRDYAQHTTSEAERAKTHPSHRHHRGRRQQATDLEQEH